MFKSLHTLLVALLFLSRTSFGQEVSISDPGLNAAVREALQKPTGPLTEQDMLRLTFLSACCRDIKSIAGLEAARNLAILDLHANLLTNCVVPGTLTNLQIVDLFQNQLTSVVLPAALSKLTIVNLGFNSLGQCSLPNGLTNLDTLFLQNNQLTSFTVPADATNLTTLLLSFNQLTNVSLTADMRRLTTVDLSSNRLKDLNLPAGLTALPFLNARSNQLANLTLPPDMQQVVGILVDGNPLTTFVLSEQLAATNLALTVATLRNEGVSVFAYPLAVSLVSPHSISATAFQFTLTGPPGGYTIAGSPDLISWADLGKATNVLGMVVFTDVQTNPSPRKYYRARL